MQREDRRVSGVDVHKRKVVICLRVGTKSVVRTYGTLTKDIQEMAQWLVDNQCWEAAMESTGSYWKPIYNIFELYGIETKIVNARHMKNVPGRKTDIKDAEWIAELQQKELLRSSYIPSREQREIREIARYRKSQVEMRASEINRLEKVLEGANIKLSSYLSEITGKSSQSLIRQAMDGEVTHDNIGDLIDKRLQDKKEILVEAMKGSISPIQKTIIEHILKNIAYFGQQIKELDEQIKLIMSKYEEAIQLVDLLPGVARRSAESVLAEIGTDMERFPSAAHLASWCGLSPGNNESAGKRKSGRTNKGNMHVKSTLIQCAQSGKKKKGSYFKAQYERIVARRGANRATVAVAHSMIIAIYHMLKNKVPFVDLGSDYYNKFNTDAKIRHHLNKLRELGYVFPSTGESEVA